MNDVNEWRKLGKKLDTAIEHNNSELHQIAEIYRRLGMHQHAAEIEQLMGAQTVVVQLADRRSKKRSA